MTSEQIKLILGIVLGLTLTASGWFIRGWYDDSHQLAIEKAIEKATAESSKAASEQIAKIPSLVTKVYTGTSKDKRYVDCVNTDEVWDSIQEAYR